MIESPSLSLFETIRLAGIPYSNHESDLYLPDNDEVRRVLERYPLDKANAVRFRVAPGNVNAGARWLDIPFAFLPWWERRRTGNPAAYFFSQ